jgi:hypothetical protein
VHGVHVAEEGEELVPRRSGSGFWTYIPDELVRDTGLWILGPFTLVPLAVVRTCVGACRCMASMSSRRARSSCR